MIDFLVFVSPSNPETKPPRMAHGNADTQQEDWLHSAADTVRFVGSQLSVYYGMAVISADVTVQYPFSEKGIDLQDFRSLIVHSNHIPANHGLFVDNQSHNRDEVGDGRNLRHEIHNWGFVNGRSGAGLCQRAHR